MEILFTIFSFVMLISIIVGIHELGHFLVARYFNIHVIKFKIGFGKEIFSITDKRNCSYSFGVLLPRIRERFQVGRAEASLTSSIFIFLTFARQVLEAVFESMSLVFICFLVVPWWRFSPKDLVTAWSQSAESSSQPWDCWWRPFIFTLLHLHPSSFFTSLLDS